MPEYSFECKKCGKIEEKYIYIGNMDLFKKIIKKNSPRCICTGRKLMMKKLIGSSQILIKGEYLGDLIDKKETKPQEWFLEQSKKYGHNKFKKI